MEPAKQVKPGKVHIRLHCRPYVNEVDSVSLRWFAEITGMGWTPYFITGRVDDPRKVMIYLGCKLRGQWGK